MIFRSIVIDLSKKIMIFQYIIVNITVKQSRMQNGTYVEHQYPITVSIFILNHLNYSELITLLVTVRTWKENT